MGNESIAKELGIGACVGVFFFVVSRLNRPDAAPLLSAAGLIQMLGAAVGGAVIYLGYKRLAPKKK